MRFLPALLLAFLALPALAAVSPDGTTILPAQTGASVTTADGTWTFGTAKTSSGNATLLNGSGNNGGFASQMEVANGGVLYANTLDGGWWKWVNGWSQTTDPGVQQQAINGQAALSFTFTAPTQDENGTALAAGAISGYTLFWGASPRAAACLKPVSTIDTACYPSHAQLAASGVLNLPVSATQTLYFSLAANSSTGLSAYSNELPITFNVTVSPLIKLPKAPTSVKVTVTATCNAGANAACTIAVTSP